MTVDTVGATAGRWDTIHPPIHPNREAWLYAAAGFLAPRFAALGAALPPLRIAIGFPSTGRGSSVIAECWHGVAAVDGVTEVWIAPQFGGDPVEVLAFLAHELCHAALGPGQGHGKAFGRLAGGLGLMPPYATYGPESIGPRFRALATLVLPWLGEFPHGVHKLINGSAGVGDDTPRGRRACGGGSDARPQSARMLKCQCAVCGYVARVSRKWLDAGGPPICPIGTYAKAPLEEPHGQMRLVSMG